MKHKITMITALAVLGANNAMAFEGDINTMLADVTTRASTIIPAGLLLFAIHFGVRKGKQVLKAAS